MDNIFPIVYDVTLPTYIKDILKWKSENMLSHIRICELDDEHVMFNYMSYIYNYIFNSKTLIALGDVPDVEPSDTDTENIYNILNHFENQITNDQQSRQQHNRQQHNKQQMTLERPVIEVEDNLYFDDDDDYLIYSIETILTKMRKKHPSLKITTMQHGNMIQIAVVVSKTPFTFILHVDTNDKSDMDIVFIEPQPDNMFVYLLEKHEYFNSGCSNIEFEEIILYISKLLENDIEIENRTDSFNINNMMKTMYTLYDITIDDYMWQEPSSTCSVNETPNNNRKLLILKTLNDVLKSKEEEIETHHIYKIIPIINYYIQIKDINCMLNNIKHYEQLGTIIEILNNKFNVNNDCALGAIIKIYKEDNEIIKHDDPVTKVVLEFYEETFQ